MTNVISFPGLGNLSFNVNRVAFTLFGREIYYYAIIILLGFLLGLLFAYKTCEKYGVSKDHVFDTAFWGLIVGIICARIYYVIFDPDCLNGNFFNIFKIWNGGLAIYGGLIGAVATAFVYSKIKKINTLKLFDVCIPGVFIGQIVGRFGNFVNAEVYGGICLLPWRMSINGSVGVHPLFLYESLWNIFGLVILLLFRRKKPADGQVFFFYTLWYSIGRFFLEGMRDPQYILWLVPNVIGISQLVSALLAVLSIAMIIFLAKKKI